MCIRDRVDVEHRKNHTECRAVDGQGNAGNRAHDPVDNQHKQADQNDANETRHQARVQTFFAQRRADSLQLDACLLYTSNYEGKPNNPIVAVLSAFLGVISRPFRFLL